MSTLRATLLAILVLATTTASAWPASALRREGLPPNIVLIYADDLGYGDLGCYGARGHTTPNLDRLAREGIRFTNFYVAQPVCSASRAALLTGCYPNRIGIHGALGPSARHGIHAEEMTLAELFKQKGYATGMAGKWHLGHHPMFLPTRHGFDEYLGLPYSNDMWPRHPEAKPGSFPPLPMFENERVVNPDVNADDQSRLTEQYTERAVKFIEKNKDRPFFFYLAHTMPHVPLGVGARFRGSSESGLYGDVIQEIDGSVGQVLAALDKNGLADDTLVIFTSDNGPWLSYGNHAGSAGPLREGKGTTFEGGVREPFLARWPGKIPAGAVQNTPAMTIDLFPTLARIVGAELPRHRIDGLDIRPLLENQPNARNPHEAYFFYYNVGELQAVRSGKWKLLLPHTSRTMQGSEPGRDGKPGTYRPLKVGLALYDLEADLGETNDRAAQNPEVVARLLGYAEKARHDLGDSLTGRKGTGLREPGQLPADEAKSKAASAPGRAKWEKEIRAYELEDEKSPPPRGAVLFIGSSSTRLWKTLARDFPEHAVINRGFGGSQIADSVAYADRIVIPYKPRLIVLQAGSNDINAGKTPEQVLADFQAFVAKVRARLPETRIAFLSLSPAPVRWSQAEKQKRANRLIEEYIRSNKSLDYIELWDQFLGPDGKPREDLFLKDRLHNNTEGYKIRADVVRPHLK